MPNWHGSGWLRDGCTGFIKAFTRWGIRFSVRRDICWLQCWPVDQARFSPIDLLPRCTASSMTVELESMSSRPTAVVVHLPASPLTETGL